MTYDLECGHCGCGFTLAAPLARAVRCPVCGGVLTVAVAVPHPPEAPPPPAPIPKPHPVPKPIAPPFVLPAPAPRGRHLAEPWPRVRNALFVARSATDFSLFLSGLFLVVGLLILPFFPAAERSSGAWLLSLLGFALVIPVVAHVIGQAVCINVPRRFGGRFVGGSVGVVVLAAGTLPEALNRGGVALALPAAFVLTSFGLWLAFLYRLGKHLPDEGLVIEATAFPWGLGLGAIVAAAMLTGAFVAESAGVRVLGWVGRVIAGATGLLLLRVYAALLRTAVTAVERRAPAAR